MPPFEPYVPLSIRYPLTVAFIMSDPVPLLIKDLRGDARDVLKTVNDDFHDIIATAHNDTDRQVRFLVNKAQDIVRPYSFSLDPC